jgi:hypothetical protein
MRKQNIEQQLNIALGIIRELLQHVPAAPDEESRRLARQRAENFLAAIDEASPNKNTRIK